MRVYLVVGNNAETLKQVLEKEGSINVTAFSVNLSEAFNNIIENDIDFDVLLLIDQGIGESIDDFARILNDFKELADTLLPAIRFKFVSKEAQYLDVFNAITSKHPNFEGYYIDKIKIPVSLFQEICMNNTKSSYEDTVIISTSERPVRKKLWNGFVKKRTMEEKPSQSTLEDCCNSNEHFSGDIPAAYGITAKNTNCSLPANISRIIAITGHRGSGKTGTVSNLAFEAANQGLKTIVIDLDLINRGLNLYFSKFGEEADLNPDLAFSLVKCITKPDSLEQNTCIINDNLYISTLAYSISNNDKMLEQITSKRLITMLKFLKSSFQLVILDLPLESFSMYQDILLHIDSVGLCMNNSLYSILNTLRSIDQTSLQEDLLIFKMKAKPIITAFNKTNTYNGKQISPDMILKILTGASDVFDRSTEVAGLIPYFNGFDLQVDTGRKLCSINEDYKNCYLNILNSLAN